MRHVIPLTVYDGFFPNPDSVRAYAQTLDFPVADGRWPGVRTKPLHLLDRKLFEYVNNRMLRIFFPDESQNIAYSARTVFQKIQDIDSIGWVHHDCPDIVTGIVYLTPTAPLNTGTSLYRLKADLTHYPAEGMEVKEQFYRDKSNAAEEALGVIANNAMFEETVNISNIYNRLVLFDSSEYHAAQKFTVEDQSCERLTLVTFFYELPSNLPYLRLRC